jgi:hypothetical protein
MSSQASLRELDDDVHSKFGSGTPDRVYGYGRRGTQTSPLFGYSESSLDYWICQHCTTAMVVPAHLEIRTRTKLFCEERVRISAASPPLYGL